jgi:phenylpropionate dioxygenase-like ring-hydroxylating dioxygenase large terminal subunit
MSEQVTPVKEHTESNAKSSEPTTELAASWYIAIPSSNLGKKPRALKLFGQPLVAWRDDAGRPVIMERYCAHLGASLAIGKVVDGCIQCPFHEFRYDRTGKCVYIPGNGTSAPALHHIPPLARQDTYVTTERYGYIWIWYGSEVPMFPLPEFPYAEREKSGYRLLSFAYPAKATALRVLENAFDPQHLICIHWLPASSIQLSVYDSWREVSDCGAEALAQAGAWFGASLDANVTSYLGRVGMLAGKLGLDVSRVQAQFSGFPGGSVLTVLINGQVMAKVLSSITPIDEYETVWHGTMALKKTDKIWTDALNYIVFGLQTKTSSMQDVAIWNTMDSGGGRFFTRYDQGVLKFRTFYRSWVDKVAPEHAKRRLPMVSNHPTPSRS